jgi:hypothetical protein
MSTHARHDLAICAITVVVCLFVSAIASAQAYDDVAGWMDGQEKATGHPPGYSVMADKMANMDARLSPEEKTRLWTEWKAVQKAAIAQGDLVEAVKAKRASVQGARITYITPIHMTDENEHPLETFYEKISFVMDKGRLRMAWQKGATDRSFGPLNVRAYDGQVVRSLNLAADDRQATGSVQRLSSRASFFESHNPLAQQMLLDSLHDEDMPTLRDHDLVNFFQGLGGNLATILESEEVIDGRKALVCVSGTVPSLVVWLDPERGLAVLRTQANMVEWVKKGDKYYAGGFVPQAVTEATDFVDSGNGIWMPRRIMTRTMAKDGSILAEDTVNVESVDINGTASDSEFRDIFPAGLQVFDGISGAAYTSGKMPDAERRMSHVLDEMKNEVSIQNTDAISSPLVALEAESTGEGVVQANANSCGQRRVLIWTIAAVALAALGLVLAFRRKRVRS